MNDPLRMGRGEAIGDRDADGDGLAPRQPGAAETTAKRRAFEQLRDGVSDAVVPPEVVDGQDVGV